MSPDLTISIYALTTIMANVEEEKFSLCLCVVYVMFVSVVSIFLRVKIYSPLFHFLYSFQSMSVLSLFGEMGDGVYGVPSYLLILLVLLNGAMSHPS